MFNEISFQIPVGKENIARSFLFAEDNIREILAITEPPFHKTTLVVSIDINVKRTLRLKCYGFIRNFGY